MGEALFISADDPDWGEANSTYFRIHIPQKYLKLAGHTIHYRNIPAIYSEVGGKYFDVDILDYSEDVPEVVLFERTLTTDRVEKLRLAGVKRIVATFDDHYGLMPKNASSFGYWHHHFDDFCKSLSMVDWSIVPSQRLKRDFERHCKGKISVVKNYHDPMLWNFGYHQQAEDHLLIGWGGSIQHWEGWQESGVIPALRQVLKERPDIQLAIYGQEIAELLGDIPNISFPRVLFEAWPSQVACFDIGLAPLGGEYDKRRSNLKLIEYGLAGVPFIASGFDPYPKEDSLGGILTSNRDWYKNLMFLIDHPDKRLELSGLGKRWAEQYTMEKHVSEYEEILW